MSTHNKEQSPGKSHTPQLSLLRNRQACDSVAIKFNASSFDEEDDFKREDFTVVNRGLQDEGGLRSSQMQVGRNGETQSSRHKAQQILAFSSPSSRSAPTSHVTTPDSDRLNSTMASGIQYRETSKLSSVHEEEKSLFSGFKEKLQGKIQNNLTAVIGKLEEISGESGIGEALERRLRKADSFDAGKNLTLFKTEKNDGGTHNIDSREPSRSRHNSADACSDVFDESGDHLADMKPEMRSNSVVMLQDFCSEPQEELPVENTPQKPRPSSTSGVSDLLSPDQSKFSLKKWNSKNKDKRSIGIECSHSVPVSMSALLSRKDKAGDLEDELMKENSQQELVTKKPSDLKNISSVERKALRNKSSTVTKPDTQPLKQNMARQVEVAREVTIETTPKKSTRFFKYQHIISLVVAVVAYVMIPMPAFVSGMVSGGAMSVCLLLAYQWWNRPASNTEPFIPPDINNKPPLRVPEMRESKNVENKFMGWMNELQIYDPKNYHIRNTKSVYVQLEGSNLRLQTPKQGIPKRAFWTEPGVYPASFIKQRFFDLSDSQVVLLPAGLVSKRIWSKKYPICVSLAKKGQKRSVDFSRSSIVDPNEAKNLGYDVLTQGELCHAKRLYLFARTSREKEEWFHRFVAATKGTPLPTRLSELIERTSLWLSMKATLNQLPEEESVKNHKRDNSTDSNASNVSLAKEADVCAKDDLDKTLMEYIQYMTHLVPAEGQNSLKKKLTYNLADLESTSVGVGNVVDNSTIWGTVPVACEPSMMWVNAALGRLFFDFLKDKYWADKVQEKIQKKLSKIHVPYFIDELTVTGIELGSQIPVIQRTSRPYLDERGLWLDVDIAYGGGFTMSLETKVNLMKLRRQSTENPHGHGHTVENVENLNSESRGSAVTDSGEEDSGESSTDDEAESKYSSESQVHSEPKGKKFLKLVDRFTQSKYFQQATKNKYINKAMQEVSRTRLVLTVEMKSCAGTMAFNIPPPPTDRLWYGFRKNPNLVLSAKPKVGHREVGLVPVTEWIERKLATEFQRVLVMPNMDDLEVPLLVTTLKQASSCDAASQIPEEAEEAYEMPDEPQASTSE